MPLGELIAAQRASGAPSVISASSEAPSSPPSAPFPLATTLLAIGPVRAFARKRLAGVKLKARERPREYWYGHAAWSGRTARPGRLARLGDAQTFTGAVPAEVGRRLLDGQGRPGAYTPAGSSARASPRPAARVLTGTDITTRQLRLRRVSTVPPRKCDVANAPGPAVAVTVAPRRFPMMLPEINTGVVDLADQKDLPGWKRTILRPIRSETETIAAIRRRRSRPARTGPVALFRDLEGGGSGSRHRHRILAVGSTDEVAQAAAPDSRIVYVDNDPIAGAGARRRPPPATRLERFGLHRRPPPRRQPRCPGCQTLDLGQPVAHALIALLHFFTDDDCRASSPRWSMPCRRATISLSRTSPRTSWTRRRWPRRPRRGSRGGITDVPRSQAEVAAFFRGLDLGYGRDPCGVAARWRRAADAHRPTSDVAVGRKPSGDVDRRDPPAACGTRCWAGGSAGRSFMATCRTRRSCTFAARADVSIVKMSTELGTARSPPVRPALALSAGSARPAWSTTMRRQKSSSPATPPLQSGAGHAAKAAPLDVIRQAASGGFGCRRQPGSGHLRREEHHRRQPAASPRRGLVPRSQLVAPRGRAAPFTPLLVCRTLLWMGRI